MNYTTDPDLVPDWDAGGDRDLYKVIIAGSREYDDYHHLSTACDFLLSDVSPDLRIEIVSGAARGADKLGELYAKERGFLLTIFPANWVVNGRSAGPLRNREMAEYADALIAFPIGKSPGTRDMIRQARQLDLHVDYANHNSPALKGMQS
jgi:hypothetical protein